MRTQEALRAARPVPDWRRREQAGPAGSDETRWTMAEPAKRRVSRVPGTTTPPESIVARLRDALTEANNRPTAWERKAEARR